MRTRRRTGWNDVLDRMVRCAAVTLAMLSGVAVASGRAQAAEKGSGCSRSCLLASMADYQRRGDRALPAGAVARENGKPIGEGDGIGRTVKGGWSGMTFADPQTSQVVFQGVVKTGAGQLVPIAVRLKIANRVVREAETVFIEKPGRFFEPHNLLQADPLYDSVLPVERRSDRGKMIAIVHSYLDALHSSDGAAVPVGPRCDKYYAGARVTNREGGLGSCAQSFTQAHFDPIAERRFPVVDSERGVVVAFFVMPRSNAGRTIARTLEVETFKIVDGTIRSVDELGHPIGPDGSSGFAAAVGRGEAPDAGAADKRNTLTASESGRLNSIWPKIERRV